MVSPTMQRHSKPEGLDIATSPVARNSSLSSDRPSMSRFPSLMSPPAATNPEPCYVAVSAASQIVTNDHDSNAQVWYDEDEIEPSGETARVSPASLKLVNAFLDQLLYNFLSVARSTSLASLRPAVTEVLKPKLAKEVIAGADQELHEYLGGGADEELVTFHNGQEPTGEWDLELVWKRTRLRVMVYSSLGDMEEEDEEMYAEQENLENPAGIHGNFTNNPGIVSPAVAIFLTSILEFLGEQVLIVSGQAAYNRLRVEKMNTKRGSDVSNLTANEIADRVVVEELDTEKVAMNPALGRLWRTWRKKLRSPSSSWSRPMSRDSYYRRNYQHSFSTSSRRSSMDTLDGTVTPAVIAPTSGLEGVQEEIFAANIPLPMRDRDIEEIEVPWLAIMEDSDDESTKTEVAAEKQRPRSLILPSTSVRRGFPRPAPSSETLKAAHLSPHLPSTTRSRSVPPPQSRQLVFPALEQVEHPAKSDSTEEPTEESTKEPTEKVGADDARELKLTTADSAAGQDPQSNDSTHHKTLSQGGVVAGMIAGAAALGSAVVGFGPSRKSVPDHGHTEPTKSAEDELQVASKPQFESHSTAGETEDEEEPQILESTRLPLEEAKASEIVETRSRTSSRSGPVAPFAVTESTNQAHPDPSFDQDREEHDPTAIGLARTSNVSVPAMALPTSPMASPGAPSPESRSIDDSYPERHALSDDEKPQHVSSKAVQPGDKPKSQFVLAAPPAPRVPRSQASLQQSAPGFLSSDGSLAPLSRTPGAEHGVPPLTPLREMMEAAHDTSDEASSITPSHSTSRSEHSINGFQAYPGHTANEQSISSSHYSHGTQMSDASSRISDGRAMPFAQTADRAGVQRVYTPPVTPRDAPTQKPRRSDSFSKSQRPTHTSGSATSQVSHKLKGLIGLPLDSSEKLPNARTSEEGRRSNSTDRDAHAKPGDKEDSFEQLIRSDETLQYTLTPQTVRESETTPPAASTPPPQNQYGESKGLPANVQQMVKAGEVSKSSRQSAEENTRPGTQQSNRSLTRAAVLPNGLRSNPPSAQSPAAVAQPNGPSALKKPYIPKAHPPPPSNRTRPPRPGMPEARGARPDRSSTRDIAEFLRSTGPDGDVAFIQPDGKSRKTNGATTASRMSTVGRLNGINSTSDLQANDPKRMLSSGSMNSNRARMRLEAREAAVPYGHHSSDLADFIRQGPPNGQLGAPNGTSTRPTQTNGRLPTNGTRNTPAPAPSVQKSYRSPPSHSKPPVASSNGAVKTSQSRDDDPPVPRRTQRRVRDPYALDSDSEEDDDDDLRPVQPVRREESLLDFLSSVPPPKPAEPKPFTSSVTAKALQKPQENGNASTFGRFGRRDSQSLSQPNGKRSSAAIPTGAVQPPQGRVTNTAPQISLPPAGRSSPLFNEPGSLGMDNYRPLNSSRGPEQVPAPKTGSRGNGAPSYQARGAKMDSGRTNDVADFLRNSGPPASTSTYAPPVKDQGGFSKMFRRKKAVA